jgi:pyruvate formate lyase activating enzyme
MKIPYIVDIKDNSLDDGTGIRSVVFFKGCPLSCVWCQNPEAQNPHQELVFEAEKCIHCAPSCYVHCPNDAFDYTNMVLLREKCQLSWNCVESCPANVFSVAGKRYDIDKLVQRFSSNIVFYQNSNGGVTLSGGEPMLYPEYTLKLIQELRKKNIDIAIETCGLFNLNELSKQILDQIQYIYFDVKLVNAEKHKQYCGIDNTQILQNLKNLIEEDLVILPEHKTILENAATKPYLIPRIPLIPEIVSSPENLRDIALLLRNLNVKLIDLLPYNPLWIKKTNTLGHNVEYNRETWMSSEEKSVAAEFFKGFEFDIFSS